MKLGIVFPGQGSQSVGMLADIAVQYPIVQDTFAMASTVLGYDLWQLVQQGPAEELDKTIHTQPALLAASYAIWQILNAKQPLPVQVLAGHSLGEYTALVCANALSFEDAVRLVAARGRFMQEAVPAGEGALAAIIGLEEAAVVELCQAAVMPGEVLAPANFNSPGQIVISGHATAIDKALTLAKPKGAKLAKRLSVSVPSHSPLMEPAARQLAKVLAETTIHQPTLPVINNVDVQVYETPEQIRDGLTRQLCMPVKWTPTIQAFAAQGVTHIIECGPGKVLTGLNKRIEGDLQLFATADLAGVQGVLADDT